MKFVMESVSLNLVIFEVAAVNVLGEGEGSSITSKILWSKAIIVCVLCRI